MIHNIKEWFKAAKPNNFINTLMRGAKRAQANARYCHDGWLSTFGWHSYLQKERAILRKNKDAVRAMKLKDEE